MINAPSADLYVAPGNAPADPYVTSTDVLLVVEVSLSSMVRDHGAKAEAYADGKIPWYWIVSRDRSIHVHRLDPAGGYEIAQVARPGAAVRVLGPEELPFTFDPAVLGRD